LPEASKVKSNPTNLSVGIGTHFPLHEIQRQDGERCSRAHCTFFESSHIINGHVVSIDSRVCIGLLNSTLVAVVIDGVLYKVMGSTIHAVNAGEVRTSGYTR
jgi:hypothetical protein